MTHRLPDHLGAKPGPVWHMTQHELARRWRVTTRTLNRWRNEDKAPGWIRINGRILYRLEEVLAFERARLRRPKP